MNTGKITQTVGSGEKRRSSRVCSSDETLLVWQHTRCSIVGTQIRFAGMPDLQDNVWLRPVVPKELNHP